MLILAMLAIQVNGATSAVVESTIEIYNQIRTQLLPTPSKPHYTFNLRDVARVIQGVMRADPKTTTEPDQLTCLWLHEASRVFADRLVNAEDTAWFRQAHLCCKMPVCQLHCPNSSLFYTYSTQSNSRRQQST